MRAWHRAAWAWAAVCVVNHGLHLAWPDLGWTGLRRGSGPRLVVRREPTSTGGDRLGVDEDALRAASADLILFSTLAKWDYDWQTAPPPPAEILALNKGLRTLVGFMSPLEPGDEVKRFLLSRHTSPGSKPATNSVVLITSQTPVPVRHEAPVAVHGQFAAAALPAGKRGPVYGMTARHVFPVQADPTAQPTQSRSEADGVVLDYDWADRLTRLKRSDPLPAVVARYDGRAVRVSGRIVGRDYDKPPLFMVALDPGEATGQSPDPSHGQHDGEELPTRSVPAKMKADAPAPGPWVVRGEFVGVLRVNRDRSTWDTEPVAVIKDAVYHPVGSRRGAAKPLLPPWLEVLAGAVILFAAAKPALALRRLKARLQTGDMYSQQEAFLNLAHRVEIGTPSETVQALLGEPQGRSQDPVAGFGDAEEVWVYALERSQDGPFLAPRCEVGGPQGWCRGEPGVCGVLVGLSSGRVVGRTVWPSARGKA